MNTLNPSVRYSHATLCGIAFQVLGPAINRREIYRLLCIDDGCNHGLSEACWTFDIEEEEDETLVRAVMVGDDRVHIVDRDDLTPLAEGAYDPECGQLGCACNQ